MLGNEFVLYVVYLFFTPKGNDHVGWRLKCAFNVEKGDCAFNLFVYIFTSVCVRI